MAAESLQSQLVSWLPTLQDAAILLAALAAFVWLRSKNGSRNLRLPPGPRGYPLIGNLHQLSSNKKLYLDFERLGRRYGPLIYLKVGSIPVVVIQDADHAQELFKTHDQVYAQRPRDMATSQILFREGEGLSFLPHGEDWRGIRKVLATKVLTKKNIRAFQSQREELILAAVKDMIDQSSTGTEVNLKEHLISLMYNTSTQMVGGKTLQGKTVRAMSKEQDEFRGMVSRLFNLFPSFVVRDWFPFARILGDFQGIEKKMKAAAAEMDQFLQKSLDDHRRAKQQREALVKLGYEGLKEDKEDFVDVLLSMEGDADKPFTDRDRKIILEPAYTGGTDSVSTIIMWSMAELCRNPGLMKKVQDEIDSVMGRDAPIREEDLGDLKMVTAVIKEAFRLHPNTPYLPRQGSADCRIGGYDIPSNARIFINIWGLMRNEKFWEDPLVFRPERFLDRDDPIDFMGNNYNFMPFGSGRRRCAGMSMAVVVAQLVLANLLHLCDFSLPRGMKPEDIDMEELPTINLSMKTPLKVFISPRLAPEFYKTYMSVGHAK